MSKRVNRTLSAAIVAVLYAGTGYAQQAPAEGAKSATELETVVVTGSLIKGTPEDASLPVEVYTAEDLRNQGDPSPLEFVKDLTISGPTTGEAYYFGGSANTNLVQFNLRGIGSDKTLLLFDGRRGSQNAAIYPSSVIDRTEILKDGAAVTYGADATGGVVNLITKKNMDGFDVGASYKTYDGTDEGEWKINATAGIQTDTANVLFAVEWDHRSELHSYERDFARQDWAKNPAPYSTLTGLAGWTPRGTLPATPTNTANGEFGSPTYNSGSFPFTSTNPINNYLSDFTQASCEAVGGVYTRSLVVNVPIPGLPGLTPFVGAPASCAYGYIGYYNLVEQNDLYRVFGQVSADLSDNMEFYFRALFAVNKSPHQYGSPAQPVIRGPARASGATNQLYVPATNPYAAEFAARAGLTGTALTNTVGYTPFTYRAFSHGGNDTFAFGDNHSTPNSNETKYWQLTAGLAGDWFGDYLGYDIAATYNARKSTNTQPDILGFRLQEALNGFGGPNCNAADLDPARFGTQNPAAAGTNGCLWWNPFASSFAGQPVLGLANPSYGGTNFENPAELRAWIFNERKFEDTHFDFTFDAVFSGTTPLSMWASDNIAWGFGLQYRTTNERQAVNDPLYNGNTPCFWPNQDPADPSDPLFTGCTPDSPGPFMFFGTNPPDATQQNQKSYFAELSLPVLDSLSFTAAARHEEFSGNLSATVYKFSGKWQVIDFGSARFALRGSYGTNYQAPGLDVIPGEVFNQVNSYTIAGGNWRGATQITRADVEPETATVWNVGAIGQFEFGSHDFQVIVDYFSIQTKDELGLLASANQIASSIFTILPAGATTLPTNGNALANCSHPLIGRVTFNGGVCTQGVTTANDFSNITTDRGNGPGQLTEGFDMQVNYTMPAGPGTLRFAATATKLEKFKFSPTILDGFVVQGADDRLGTLNFATIGQAAPEWRANFSINYNIGEHNIRGVVNYVSSVLDERFVKADGTVNIASLRPGGYQPGTTTPFEPSYYGLRSGNWMSGDIHYTWRANWATLGLSVLNVTDEDPPESRQEFGYDPRMGNPLGRQIEVSLRKEF